MNLDIGCGVNPKGDVNCDLRKLRGIKNFVCCDANFLPFKHDSFNLIFVHNILEHVDEPFVVMNECNRIGQTKIYSVDSFVNPLNWLHPCHQWLTFNLRRHIYFLRRPHFLKAFSRLLYYAIYGNRSMYKEYPADRRWWIEPWLQKRHIIWIA